jgi:hypothetical protein
VVGTMDADIEGTMAYDWVDTWADRWRKIRLTHGIYSMNSMVPCDNHPLASRVWKNLFGSRGFKPMTSRLS